MEIVQNDGDKLPSGRIVKFNRPVDLGSRKGVRELPCREISTQEFLDNGYPFSTDTKSGMEFDANKILLYLSLMTEVDEEVYKANLKYADILQCAFQIAPYLSVDLGLGYAGDDQDKEDSKKK